MQHSSRCRASTTNQTLLLCLKCCCELLPLHYHLCLECRHELLSLCCHLCTERPCELLPLGLECGRCHRQVLPLLLIVVCLRTLTQHPHSTTNITTLHLL